MTRDVVSREVTWKVLDIAVYGFITEPKEREAKSAIVFVAGSGPTDRNWCSPLLPGTNGSGKLVAEALAANGFVTLRYDKVASGPHVKENFSKFAGKLSMQTHLDELAGAVETVLSESKVGERNLYALTNSEGAIHAVNYQLQAKKNRFKGLVLTGAPGRSIGDLGRAQVSAQAKSLSSGDAIMKQYDDAILLFTAGKEMVIDPSLPEPLKLLLRALETPANLPFSRELWAYSLPEHLAKVPEPVLVVIGKKDLQIDWKIDGAALEKATAGKTNISFAYPEDADHVLKHEETRIEKLTVQIASLNYCSPDSAVDGGAERAILQWLNKQK